MKIIQKLIGSIIPYARNPRNNETSIAKVAASIKEFGWQQPIVVDGENVVIVGHTRLEAARQLGLTEVPVHVAEGLSDAQIRAYRIADNRTGQESEWNPDLLKSELAELQSVGFDMQVTGFSVQEVDLMLQPEEQESAASGLPTIYRSQERQRLDADPNRIIFDGRRILITPAELQRGKARVADYILRNGAVYGFVSELLGIESISNGEDLV